MNAALDLSGLRVRSAKADDLAAVLALLAAGHLPVGDLGEGLPGQFFVAESAGKIVALVGLETLGDCGLLRSLAVGDAWQRRRLGSRLVDECEASARGQGLRHLYLLTTTAADYFRRRDYTDVARESVPAAIAGHAQFRSLCPSSAKCLVKAIG